MNNCRRKSRTQAKKTIVKNKSSVADRGLSKRTRGRQAHEENIRQHERTAALNEQRTLNRPSHMRHVEVLRTGHDVISNRVFTGRNGRPPPQPRAKAPLPVWDRLAGQRRESSEATATGALGPPAGREAGRGLEEKSTGATAIGSSGRGHSRDGGGHDSSIGSSGHAGRSGDRENEQQAENRTPPGEGNGVGENGADAARSKPAVPRLDLSLREQTL